MRIVNRPLAFLLALGLLAASVILIVEVIAHALNANPVVVDWRIWQDWAERTHWNRAVIKVWSIILIVVGLAVLLLELKPRRVRRLGVQSDNKATDAAMTRRGLAGALSSAAADVDGVRNASVAVSRRRARVTATSAAHDKTAATALSAPVTAAVQQRLDTLELKHRPKLTVHVTNRGR